MKQFKYSISNGLIRIDYASSSRPDSIRVSTTIGSNQSEVQFLDIYQARSHYKESMTCGMHMKQI